jgi:hypothetical protein
MRLLREIRCTANDIVTAWLNSRDNITALLVRLNPHTITHNNGISRAHTLKAQLSTYAALQALALVQHLIPATRRTHDGGIELLGHN